MEQMTIEIYHKELVKGEVDAFLPLKKNRWEGMEELSAIQFSSVAQSCLTLRDPVDCSMPGLPVHHQLPELTQTHIHGAGDALQPSHPLSSPSLPVFNLS